LFKLPIEYAKVTFVALTVYLDLSALQTFRKGNSAITHLYRADNICWQYSVKLVYQ